MSNETLSIALPLGAKTRCELRLYGPDQQLAIQRLIQHLELICGPSETPEIVPVQTAHGEDFLPTPPSIPEPAPVCPETKPTPKPLANPKPAPLLRKGDVVDAEGEHREVAWVGRNNRMTERHVKFEVTRTEIPARLGVIETIPEREFRAAAVCDRCGGLPRREDSGHGDVETVCMNCGNRNACK